MRSFLLTGPKGGIRRLLLLEVQSHQWPAVGGSCEPETGPILPALPGVLLDILRVSLHSRKHRYTRESLHNSCHHPARSRTLRGEAPPEYIPTASRNLQSGLTQ